MWKNNYYVTTAAYYKSMATASVPAAKKQKRECHFDKKWIEEFQGIGRSSKGILK